MMDRKSLTAITRVAIGIVLLAAGAAAGAQQMYKWVDARGVTHFSDKPPSTSQQKTVRVKSYNGSGGSVDMPFDLAQAVRSAPVTLFTTATCLACDNARQLLLARGVPHTEKTVTTAEDMEQLKQAGGAEQLPFILIGRKRLTGFDSEALAGALDIAAYPVRRVVPENFKLGRVVAAAEPKPAPEPVPGQQAQSRGAATASGAQSADQFRF